jgi:hypothetical protein
MTHLKETDETLEELKVIPDDATDEERERLRDKNAEIRKRNQQRIDEAQTVARLTTTVQTSGQ